jgi:hypothetical protein
MVSRWSNFPIFTARNGQIKVWPLYMEHPVFDVTSDIVMGGCAPVTFIDAGAGTSSFCYFPSSVHSVNLSGDAHITVDTAGVLCATYLAPPYGVDLGGEAPITVTLGGLTSYCYPATGGITMGGEADATLTRVVKERGGKGTPHWKRQKQATHYYFAAEAYFENTLQLGGAADASFRPAPYQFIKSLPKVPYTPPRRDSEFVDLFKRLEAQPKTTTFSYEASGGVTTAGEAKDKYFDFRNFIIMHDEDVLIADILSTDGSPYITTTFDNNLAKLRRDDDEVIEIFELL